MSELHKRLISQLDSLVPFLALGHNEVYDVLRDNYSDWYEPEKQGSLPEKFHYYQTQVAHAGFLLGFSYVEAFLVDVAKEAFRRRPEVLPKDKELKFRELLDCGSYETIIEKMIEKEILSLFYGSFENIGTYFQEKLSLPWSDSKNIVKAPLIRNCIIHNDSIVDQRLSSVSELDIGEKITLNASDVHDYGIAMRDLAYRMDKEFERRYPAV